MATFPKNLEMILNIQEEYGDEGLEGETSTTTADKAFHSQKEADWIWDDEADVPHLPVSQEPTSSRYS